MSNKSKKVKEEKEVKVKEENNLLGWLPLISCKSENQKRLVKQIENKDIVICSGPAGTGKTYLALLKAFHLLRSQPARFDNIILVKSVTTVKRESLGFLPGNTEEKMDPYMFSYTWLIDKIFKKEGKSKQLMEKGMIKWLPLAFIRGINIDRSIVILDETQNIDIDLFRTIITRLGEDSKIIFLGDSEQIDLDKRSLSCLNKIMNIFEESSDVGIVRLTEEDCVRNKKIPMILEKLKDIK